MRGELVGAFPERSCAYILAYFTYIMMMWALMLHVHVTVENQKKVHELSTRNYIHRV